MMIYDAGYWMPVAGCLMLDTGCWLPDTGYRMLDTGYWISQSSIKNQASSIKHPASSIKLILPLFLFFSVVSSLAQSTRYQVETFGNREGLLSPKIYTLTQTTDRRLWIGSELGLSVFDGYRFYNYQYSSQNESIGRILAIAQDSSGAVWIGGDNGLFHFHNDTIVRIKFNNRPPVAIESLLTDHEGNLWVGELNFLYRLMHEQVVSATQKNQTSFNVNPFANLKERAFSLAMDKNHEVYFGSHGGIFLLNPSANSYSLIWKNPDVNNFVQSIAVINRDSIYLSKLDGQPEQLINGKLSSFYDKNFVGRYVLLHRNQPYAITSNNFASLSNGLKPLVYFENFTNHVHAGLMDAEDNIWLGTWEGLLKYRKTAFSVFTLEKEEHSEVFSMLESNNNELLFGGNRGKVFVKKDSLIIRHPQIPLLFKGAEVMCMFQEADGTLWSGSGYQGISRWKNNKVDNWVNTGNLKDNNCEELFYTNGKILAATENGVSEIDPAAQEVFTDHYAFKLKYGRAPEIFGTFIRDDKYWFYGSQGLYHLENKLLVEDSIDQFPIKNLYINRIIEDRNGNIWIATQGKGLLKCTLKNRSIQLVKQYDSKNGLPSDNALSVITDKNNNIWCGDYSSVSMLSNNNGQEQWASFGAKDGLLSANYQTLKLAQQKNGTIWGLTTMGPFSFHPDSISLNKLPPVLLINTILASKDRSDNKIYSAEQSFSLSYKVNSIQFNYTAISLTDPSRVRYAYRIPELDSNWIYTQQRIATFNFLPPGRYHFEIIASNNNNIWISKPVRVAFTIDPPFWKTIWFRILAIALIILLLYLLFQTRLRTVRTKAAIKQQMAELEGKALRAQINPHFIFNSLNAIQKLIVVQDMDASYNYLSKFSKLLRLVLDNSDKNYISLSQELEMNRLYLELESLRFKNSFEYYISLNQQSDPDIILIPSLLLQPFIENAIWHGLMHKEGDKKLSINFTEDSQYLICSIEDNGIGRDKSSAIKSQKLGAQYFNSKGTQLSEQRIKLLHELGNETAVEYIDLKNDRNEAIGTRVIIKIPLHKSK